MSSGTTHTRRTHLPPNLFPRRPCHRLGTLGWPTTHWRKIWPTNPIERLNKEIKRRTDVVGIFPNNDALLRLAACVLIEAHDEWQDASRCYLSESSMALLYPPDPTSLRTVITTTVEEAHSTPELATA